MNNRWLFAVAALAACGISGMAAAQSLAYVAPGTTNLRDGPGTRYPVVARVYGGTPVEVYGCLADRSWCEVSVDEIVGWMAASRLQFVYAGRHVYVPDYYSHFRAPIIEFRIGRNWSWRDRERHCPAEATAATIQPTVERCHSAKPDTAMTKAEKMAADIQGLRGSGRLIGDLVCAPRMQIA